MDTELESLRWQLKAQAFDNDALHRQRLQDAQWRGYFEPKIAQLADFLERCAFGPVDQRPSNEAVQKLLDEVQRPPAPIARSLVKGRVRTDL
jgi:hypothetical protein